MNFERHILSATILDPATDEQIDTTVEVRVDPLTGHTSRILPDRGLMPPGEFDLEAFARENQPRCPFCPRKIDSQTPRLPPEIHPDGRIRTGEAVLFPNLHAYSSHSSVSVYSPHLHYLPLEEISEQLLVDNLTTQVAFANAVMSADPESRWASINANHMLPSGSSLFHPHLQGICDSQPTTFQKLLAQVPPAVFMAYIEKERTSGERFLGDTGSITWLASFAPVAPAEVRGFVSHCSSSAELSESDIIELAHGLAAVLHTYADLGYQSFNLAVYGAPPRTDGYPLNLRLAVRSNLKPFYRSDSTFLERLHWEGAIDVAPESVAEPLRGRLQS